MSACICLNCMLEQIPKVPPKKKVCNVVDGQYGLPVTVVFEDGSERSLADVLNDLMAK